MPRQCDMIFLPALRLATRPFPPGLFAARFFAAVIRPPRLFLAIRRSPPLLPAAGLAVITPQYARGRSQVNRKGKVSALGITRGLCFSKRLPSGGRFPRRRKRARGRGTDASGRRIGA